jgi:hypothetical protein
MTQWDSFRDAANNTDIHMERPDDDDYVPYFWDRGQVPSLAGISNDFVDTVWANLWNHDTVATRHTESKPALVLCV